MAAAWTLKEGEEFLNSVRPLLIRFGYSARIVGSVKEYGHSNKDLDILLTPIHDEIESDIEELAYNSRWQLIEADANYEMFTVLIYPDHKIVDFWVGVIEESVQNQSIFHVAPTDARSSIRKYGIDATKASYDRSTNDEGFYAFRDLGEAKWYAEYMGNYEPASKMDVWKVTTNLKCTGDSGLSSDDEQETTAIHHCKPAGPKQIKLVYSYTPRGLTEGALPFSEIDEWMEPSRERHYMRGESVKTFKQFCEDMTDASCFGPLTTESMVPNLPPEATDPAPGKLYYYHTTASWNIPEIRATGLGHEGGETSLSPHLPSVHFWAYAMSEPSVRVLRVPRNKVRIKTAPDYYEKEETSELLTYQIIPPQDLEVYDDESNTWKHL